MDNYSFDITYKEVDKIQTEEGAALGDHIIKLSEEVGEISESYLMLKGYKDPKRSVTSEEFHLAEESIDAIIVAMAILSRMKVSDAFVMEKMKEKVEKWRIRHEKKTR